MKADATELDIAQLCEEAVEYGFATVCIPPGYVSHASRLLYGSDTAVCTVIGFPLGYQTTEVKVFEAQQAIECGANEIDMVINLGKARSGDFAAVQDDMKRVVAAAGPAVVKIIIECCLFDNQVKRDLANLVAESGAGFVKTSTGFAASGATVEDVGLLHQVVAGKAAVKAAGGIRDWSTCQAMLASGATRIGTSSGIAIVQGWRDETGLICP